MNDIAMAEYIIDEMVKHINNGGSGGGIYGGKIVSWADGYWNDIEAMLKAHDSGLLNIYDYWHVGDVKKIYLPAIPSLGFSGTVIVDDSHVLQEIQLVLVDKDVVDIADGGKCHFVWQQKDLLSNLGTLESGYMDSSKYSNGWLRCARRTWCNELYYNSLPKGLRNITKTARIKSRNNANNPTIQETDDKIFLPCRVNIFGGDYWTEEDSIQWEYYKTASKIKYPSGSITAGDWWLRTMTPSGSGMTKTTGFIRANNNGSVSVADSGSYGIAPCGCF